MYPLTSIYILVVYKLLLSLSGLIKINVFVWFGNTCSPNYIINVIKQDPAKHKFPSYSQSFCDITVLVDLGFDHSTIVISSSIKTKL